MKHMHSTKSVRVVSCGLVDRFLSGGESNPLNHTKQHENSIHHKEPAMKRFVFKIQTALLVVFLLTPSLIQLSAHALPDDRFSDEELDELLAPIALYPDPLLAQVVPASTFIDQLEEAQRTLGGSTDDNHIIVTRKRMRMPILMMMLQMWIVFCAIVKVWEVITIVVIMILLLK